jgi:hypothetical protein
MTTSEMTSLKSYIVETNTELNTDLSTIIVQQRILKRKWRNFIFVRVKSLRRTCFLHAQIRIICVQW